MQQQQAEVAPDQKEDEKRPDTPPLILDDATPQNSDASGPSYSSTFQQDVMQKLQSRTRSGQKFSAHEVLVSFVEELSPDKWAFHNNHETCNQVAIDDEVGRHIEVMIEKTAPSDVWLAMEIPEFRKAIDEELKTINEFHTYDLVP